MGNLNKNEIKEKFLGTLQTTQTGNISGNVTLDIVLNEVLSQVDTLIKEVHVLEERLNSSDAHVVFLDLMDLGIFGSHALEQTVHRLRMKASYMAGVIHQMSTPVDESVSV